MMGAGYDRGDWHACPSAQAMARLSTGEAGLSANEAMLRLASHGANRLPPPRRPHALARFAAQFHNILVYMLLASIGVTLALRHWIDAAVILAVVLINAVIGFIQEGKAEQALARIRGMLSAEATVLRGGERRIIPAEQVVAGDLIVLQSGDKAPADVRLITARDLHIDESVLTGESTPVSKNADAVGLNAPLAERTCMAYSGTLVLRGQAHGVVVATGGNTELGRINALLRRIEPISTPLLRQMSAFGRRISLVVGVVATVTLGVGLLRGYHLHDMFIAAVGLAVAAIPEGMPAVLTIALAVGVRRMAARHAIVRHLPAIDTIGSVSVICTDKTGTLTRNEMTVRDVVMAGGALSVSGAGYAPDGGFQRGDATIDPRQAPGLIDLARAAALCNDAALRESGGAWQLEGDPTEGALLSLSQKAGLERDIECRAWPRLDEIPFESERRFMATLHHDHAGHALICVKGAPERVLAMCAHDGVPDASFDRVAWLKRSNDLAAAGRRVLAIAARPLSARRDVLSFEDVESGLTLLGLVGMMDPPRPEAIEAIRACRDAGIAVKMITGDHAATALAIAGQMGIGDGKTVLTGSDLDAMDDARFAAAVRKAEVFARVNPEHKLRLVEALQRDGKVTAMTGDGVNDAPALKRADVGVAMGLKGNEVAKEASDIVLADDNFATLASAVRAGRVVYDNIRKTILFILPTNGGEALTIVASILSGATLPITPIQILWINMVTDVALALTLALESDEADVMRRRPRHADAPLIPSWFAWRIAAIAATMCAATFGIFLWSRGHGADVPTSRTLAVNTVVMFQIFYLFACRSGLFSNRYVWFSAGLVVILQILYTYLPAAHRWFDTRPIGALEWLAILVVASSAVAIVGLEKLIRRNTTY